MYYYEDLKKVMLIFQHASYHLLFIRDNTAMKIISIINYNQIIKISMKYTNYYCLADTIDSDLQTAYLG